MTAFPMKLKISYFWSVILTSVIPWIFKFLKLRSKLIGPLPLPIANCVTESGSNASNPSFGTPEMYELFVINGKNCNFHNFN